MSDQPETPAEKSEAPTATADPPAPVPAEASPVEERGLVARPSSAANSLDKIEETFSEQQKTQIADYLGLEANDPSFVPYLATCAQYGLDPVMGQIWLIEMKEKEGRDGAEAKKVKKPAVGRDGFLAIARRTPEFEGMEFDVVCAKDTFEKRTENGIPSVFHQYPSLDGNSDIPAKYRGDIIGAYCIVYVRGKKPTYYFAWLKEHAKVGTNSSTGQSYYKSAWKYTSVMILKAAQSVALRLALGVTGVVGADELREEGTDPETSGTGDGPPSPAAYLAELDVDDELKTKLQTLVAAANEARPNSWSLAKVRMRLEGRGAEGVEKVVEELEAERDSRAEAEARAVAAEEDAVLVEEAKNLEPPFLLRILAEGEGEEVWIQIDDVAVDPQAGAVTLVADDGSTRDYGLEDEVEIRKTSASSD